MVFKLPATLSVSLKIALHAVIIAALMVTIFHLLATTHYYATALVLTGLATMTIISLSASIARLEAPIVQLMNNALAGAPDIPVWGGRRVEAIVLALQEERRQRAECIEYLQAQIDSVAGVLIVVSANGRLRLANRAARALAGEEANTLSGVATIGPAAAQEILALRAGARKIVRLANGQQVLASVVHFSVPGTAASRMIALQSIVGELDAVELKAWQDMARILAHEMMNSLTPITSLSESLIARLHDDSRAIDVSGQDLKEAVETIGRRSQGLMNFVERYREFAQLPEPRLQKIRAGEFVAGIDSLMRPSLAERGIEYRSAITPTEMELHADPVLLTQATINLLKNAADAVANVDNPAITLSCNQEIEQAVVTVSDNGVGLSAEQADTVFVPFFTTKPGGSGIGLSLARQIALAHGGQIVVKSNTPRGTIFCIALPCVD